MNALDMRSKWNGEKADIYDPIDGPWIATRGARMRHLKLGKVGVVEGWRHLCQWDWQTETMVWRKGLSEDDEDCSYLHVVMRWDDGTTEVVEDTNNLVTADWRPPLSERAGAIQAAITSIGDIQPSLEYSDLLEGLLDRGTLSVVYGAPGSGKTFFVIEIGVHIAARMEWRGHHVGGQDTMNEWSGPVLYIALEGGRGVNNRISALRIKRPELVKAAEDDSMFYLLSLPIDLHGPDDAAAILSAVDSLSAIGFGLIVIDTLARAMGAGNENDTGDMGQFVRNCDLIREETGSHVLIVHHSGKDASKGARGSTALRAAADTEIEVRQESGIITVKATKQRDMSCDFEKTFAIETVELGLNERRKMVTSGVLIEAEPVRTGPRLSGSQEVAMQALDDALLKHGKRIRSPDYPARSVVSSDHWRAMCDTHGLTESDDPDTRRKTFNRAKKALIEKNLIRCFDGHFWKVNDDD